MQTNGDQSTNDRRLTVPEAAEALGISPEAVRARIHRGTLRKDKAPDGTVYVRIIDDRSRPIVDDTPDQSGVEEVLREQVTHLRGQLDQEREANRENRRIIAALIQRVPELEAPQRPSEAREGDASYADDAGHQPEGNGAAPQGAPERRSEQSWWRRWFGFE
jgi:hypothetical protein